MIESLLEALEKTPAGEALITFVVAMLPVVELRGAIPIGVGMGLGHWEAMIVSILGNMLPVPFIILFIRKIFKWLCRHSVKLAALIERLERSTEDKQETVKKYKVMGLMILVAIPLPGTGAWTGALIAALLDMRIKVAFPTIFLGVLIAGFIVTGITVGFTAIF